MNDIRINVDKVPKALFDSQLMAQFLFGITLNNLVKTLGFTTLMIIDAALHFYLVTMQVFKQYYGTQFELSSNVIESYLNMQNLSSYLIAQIAIIVFLMGLLSLLVVLLYLRNTRNIHFQSIEKVISVVFSTLMTCIQIPLFEIMIGVFFSNLGALNDGSTSSNVQIGLIYLLSIVNLIMLLSFVYFLSRLYIVRISCISAPCAQSSSQMEHTKVIGKILLVISHLYVTTGGSTPIYLVTASFIFFGGAGFSKVLVIQHYNRIIAWMSRLTELLTACLLLILLVQIAAFSNQGQTSSSMSFIFIVMVAIPIVPGTIGLSLILNKYREHQVWTKLEKGQITNEIDQEYALKLLIERFHQSFGSREQESQMALGDLFYFIEVHSRSCFNPECGCHKIELMQYFVNKSYVSNQSCVPLEIEETSLIRQSGSNDYFQIQSDLSQQDAKISQKKNIIETQRVIEQSGELNAQKFQNGFSHDKRTKFSGLSVDSIKFKKSLILKIIKTYFDGAKSKYPHSTLVIYQVVTFALRCCLNKYMTQALLINFSTSQVGAQKRSWFEQVSIKFNELYILMQLDIIEDNKFESEENPWGFVSEQGVRKKRQSSNDKYSFLQKCDIGFFIKSSQIKLRFFDRAEKLALSTQSIWRFIQQSTLNVAATQKESMILAEMIDQVFQLFASIQEDSGDSNSGRHVDQQVCYTFALIQKLLLNDAAQHDLYEAKIQSQKDLIKLLKNNMMQYGQSNVGFMLVSGLPHNFGTIHITNQVFQNTLQYSSSELNSLSIGVLMPTIIRQWHPQFVYNFNNQSNSSSYLLNNVIMIFVKQKSGYVIPAILNLKFHYSHEYEYTFSCFTTQLEEMQFIKPDGVVKHPTQEVLFLLCSDDDWSVLEISESCQSKLGLQLQRIHGGVDNIDELLTLDRLLPQLTLQKLKHLDASQGKGLCILDETVEIDMNMAHSKTREVTYRQSKRAYCQIFKERYGINRDKCLNIVTLVMLETNGPISELQIGLPSSLGNQWRELQESFDNGNVKQFESIQKLALNVALFPEKEEDLIDEGGSESNTSAVQNEASDFKQLISQAEKRSSKNLTLITQLLFLVFILLIALSSLNVILSNGKYLTLQTQITAVSYAYTRITSVAYIRSMVRGMLNQANGLGKTLYADQFSRFITYQQGFQSKLLVLQQAQAYLDRPDATLSSTLADMLSDNSVQVIQLDQYDNPMYTNDTFNIAMNLYISRASQVALWSFVNFTGNISQMRLIASPTNYTPTMNERTFYYLIMTAMGNMRIHGVALAEQYKQDSEDDASSVAKITLITIIISIIAILLVCLILSPIIFRVEQHKYIGLQFLLEVDRNKLPILDQQAQNFLKYMVKNNNQSESKEGSQKNIKLIGINSSEYSADMEGEEANGVLSFNPNSKHVRFEGDNIVNNWGKADSTINQSYPLNGALLNDLNNSEIKSLNKNQVGDNSLGNQVDEDTSEKSHDENQNSQTVENDKFHQIKRIIDQQRIKVVFLIMLIGLCLSSYFVAAYFFSVQPFLEVPTYLGYIDQLYLLDFNFQTTMSSIRDDLVLNASTPAIEDSTQAQSDYFLNQFLTSQVQYLQFRKNIPPIYNSLSGFFAAIETDQVCNVTFQGTVNASSQEQTCATTLNGIILTGLSNTLEYFYRNQKTNRLDFIENKHTLKFLLAQLHDTTTSALLGLRQQTVTVLQGMIETLVIQATITYFNSLASSYLILFGTFVLVLVMLFSASVHFVYRNIRRNMRKTNLALKILPIEYLPKEVLQKLKQFSNY